MYEEQPAIIDIGYLVIKNKIIRNPASNFKSLSQKTPNNSGNSFLVLTRKNDI